MLTLLIAVALATLFAIFATQNTALVALNFGGHLINGVPLYIAILVPLLAGLFMAYFLHILKNLSQSLTMSEQKDKIKNLERELAETGKSAHKLQVENLKLKKDLGLPRDGNSI